MDEEHLKAIHAILGAEESDHFLATSHANFQVYMSHMLDFVRQTGRNHIFTTEENPILTRLHALGSAVKVLPLNTQGQLSLSVLQESIRPRTALLSLAWADGFTGVIQPTEDIAKICHERDVRLHIDATHVVGKLFFRFQDLPCDFLTFEEGLFIKSNTLFEPVLPLLNNFSSVRAYLEKARDDFDYICTETARLRNKLEDGIDETVLFQNVERLPHISAIELPVATEPLLFLLHRRGVRAKAKGTAISFTLSRETTENEIDHIIEVVTSSVEKLKMIGGIK